MAKKPVGRVKSSAATPSKKLKYPAKSVKKTVGKKTSSKAKGRISYKQEYIKLLQKTNKTLTKEVKAIRKAISQPRQEEAFPKEPTRRTKKEIPSFLPPATSIEQQILEQLIDLEIQIRSRDMAFEDLISGSAKLGGYND
jgi:hypothetical protein